MFDDDDDLFDLVDDPLEWDPLLDDDELEHDRRRSADKAGARKDPQGREGRSGKKRHRGLFGGLFG